MSDLAEVPGLPTENAEDQEMKARREFLKKFAGGAASGVMVAPAVAMLMAAADANAQPCVGGLCPDPYQGGGGGCGCGCGCSIAP